MKAIRRNVLLACLISTFAFFGAVSSKPIDHSKKAKYSVQQLAAKQAEANKETLICLSIGILAWVLCFWRCAVINKRISQERMYMHRFNEYMRNNLYTSKY